MKSPRVRMRCWALRLCDAHARLHIYTERILGVVLILVQPPSGDLFRMEPPDEVSAADVPRETQSAEHQPADASITPAAAPIEMRSFSVVCVKRSLKSKTS